MQVLDELSANPETPNSGSGGLRYDGLMLLPKPVIAAVHGPCAGIGLAMACAADIRLAAEDAFFVAPFAGLGLCAEGGLAWSLSRLIGPGNAADMLMSARRVGAQEAYAKGLVSQVLPNDGFIAAATEDFEAARTDAHALTQETLKSADFKESMTAKREKRLARFTPVTSVFEPPVSKS
jgi:enoyl-CoA hydratase/carnithine racemase